MQVAVLADCPTQRLLLEQVLQQHGCRVLWDGAMDGSAQADAWLVSLSDPDSLAEGLLEQLYDSGVPVLVDEGHAPQAGSDAFVYWQRQLTDKLTAALGQTAGSLAAVRIDEQVQLATEQLEVWLLAASSGGLTAVKEFLDNLPDDLPIAFLYAQHIDPAFEAQLPRAVGRHSKWQVSLATANQSLQAGTVVVVPTGHQLDFHPDGRLHLLAQPWAGSYTPSINSMMLNLARCYGPRSGLIVFSGMGEDGSAACAEASEQGMRIWVQESDSCTCPAMPDSIRDTGLSLYSATPRHLALALLNHVRSRKSAAR